VVFLSAYLDGAVVYSAVAGGAAAYLSKEADRQEICDAIAAVARGERPPWVAPFDPARFVRR
jgi:two-component system nitrate/nitrite response regulator NarL